MDLDATGGPVKKYQSDVLHAEHGEREKLYFDNYKPEDLEHIMDAQNKITKHVKKQ